LRHAVIYSNQKLTCRNADAIVFEPSFCSFWPIDHMSGARKNRIMVSYGQVSMSITWPLFCDVVPIWANSGPQRTSFNPINYMK
jgi:hypothetical protein